MPRLKKKNLSNLTTISTHQQHPIKLLKHQDGRVVSSTTSDHNVPGSNFAVGGILLNAQSRSSSRYDSDMT